MSVDSVLNSIADHPTTWSLLAAYLFIAAVNTMPEPSTKLPGLVVFYQWIYDFLHVLSNKVVQKYPQIQAPQQIIHTFATSVPPTTITTTNTP